MVLQILCFSDGGAGVYDFHDEESTIPATKSVRLSKPLTTYQKSSYKPDLFGRRTYGSNIQRCVAPPY